VELVAVALVVVELGVESPHAATTNAVTRVSRSPVSRNHRAFVLAIRWGRIER
jgi:hypothetical protein